MTPALIDMPTCPVCLERLDTSVSGLLTIVCNHTFHCQCYARWPDCSCPVCRHAPYVADDGSGTAVMDAACETCDSRDNLWMCLLCAHVGCGRTAGGHAQAHFQESLHPFSLQLGTQCVWDYVGDAYVHRLVQGETDGKLVEVPKSEATSLEDAKLGGKVGLHRTVSLSPFI